MPGTQQTRHVCCSKSRWQLNVQTWPTGCTEGRLSLEFGRTVTLCKWRFSRENPSVWLDWKLQPQGLILLMASMSWAERGRPWAATFCRRHLHPGGLAAFNPAWP